MAVQVLEAFAGAGAPSPDDNSPVENPVKYNHGHFYQPPRYNAIELEELFLPIFDITGLQDNPNIQANYSLGFNQKLAERSVAPAVALDRIRGRKAQPHETPDPLPLLASGAYSINMFGIYRDWIRYNMPEGAPGDWGSIKRAVELSGIKPVGDPYLHLIMPGLSLDTQRMLLRIGNQAFLDDWGTTPDFVWLPEIAMDMATLTALAREGVRGTIALRRQIKPLNPGDEHAPAYKIQTEAGPIFVIVADNDISREQSFAHPDAGTFVYQGQAAGQHHNGKNYGRVGIFDGERFGEHWNDIYDPAEPNKHHGAFEFMYWRDYFLNLLEQEGKLTRSINFAEMPEATLAVEADGTNSWSCAHGTGRWKGECLCDLDHLPKNWQEYVKEEKHDLWTKMQQAQLMVENVLDNLFPEIDNTGIAMWRNRFGTWLLSQRENIAKKRPVSTKGTNLTPSEKRLFVIYEALLFGGTSCGLYFAQDSYERQLPRETLRVLTEDNVLAKMLQDVNPSERQSFAIAWKQLTPKDPYDMKVTHGILSREEADRLKIEAEAKRPIRRGVRY